MCNSTDNKDEFFEGENEEYEQFFESMSSKLEIFDPMDRDIPDDNDQTIKRLDLLNRILNMEAIPGSRLQAPMSNSMFQKVEQLISNGQKRCNDVLQHHL